MLMKPKIHVLIFYKVRSRTSRVGMSVGGMSGIWIPPQVRYIFCKTSRPTLRPNRDPLSVGTGGKAAEVWIRMLAYVSCLEEQRLVLFPYFPKC
jgi:hypothetical protein